jgi:hypothetical protein
MRQSMELRCTKGEEIGGALNDLMEKLNMAMAKKGGGARGRNGGLG